MKSIHIESLESRQFLSTADISFAQLTPQAHTQVLHQPQRAPLPSTLLSASGSVVIPWDGAIESARNSVVQSDGKILILGRAADEHLVLIRTNPDGSLDPTFGDAGVVQTNDPLSCESASAMDVGPGGKIVVYNGTTLIRFLPDGQIDSTFGDAGRAKVNSIAHTATDVRIVSKGTIIVTSWQDTNRLKFVRFTVRGQRDTTFGVNGTLSLKNWDCFGRAVDLGNGKLLLSGGPLGFSISRFQWTKKGGLDKTFGKNGATTNTFGVKESIVARRLTTQKDGKIIAVGSTRKYDRFIVARYTPDGKLDKTFNRTGYVIQSVTGKAVPKDIDVLPNGQILVTAWDNTSSSARNSFVFRFDAKGSLKQTIELPLVAGNLFLQSSTNAILVGHANDKFALQTISLVKA